MTTENQAPEGAPAAALKAIDALEMLIGGCDEIQTVRADLAAQPQAPWSKTVESAALLINRATDLPMDDCEGLAGTILGMAATARPAPAEGARPLAWRYKVDGGPWLVTTDEADARYYTTMAAWTCEPLYGVQPDVQPKGTATLTITAPNGDKIVVHGSALDMATLEKVIHAKTQAPAPAPDDPRAEALRVLEVLRQRYNPENGPYRDDGFAILARHIAAIQAAVGSELPPLLVDALTKRNFRQATDIHDLCALAASVIREDGHVIAGLVAIKATIMAEHLIGRSARLRAAGMGGLLSEILGKGALNHYGDADLIERVEMAVADQEAAVFDVPVQHREQHREQP